MASIHRLSPSVVNKIAAGEVIERPASVVKELMENAVDSGATQIEVSLRDGGLESIRVADNGSGISPEDLPLAVAPHATSKIRDADDLFRVSTMGFRGEALASIAEVSQLTIRSRTRDATIGYELRVSGGQIEPLEPCGCSVGTAIEVSSLFFTTPVRQKFLRSLQTEMGHTVEAFTRIALAHPQIQMVLRHNDRVVHELPAQESWPERIGRLLGEEIRDALIPIAGQDQAIQLQGYAVDPVQSRSHNRLQYVFLNGRYIRERSLQHALAEAYRGLLLTGRYPIAFLALSMPPEAVDVNVHPAKLEVRFLDGGRIYSLVLGSIRNKFLTTDLTARTTTPAAPAALAGIARADSAPWDLPGAPLPGGYTPLPQQRDIPLPHERRLVDFTSAPTPSASWASPIPSDVAASRDDAAIPPGQTPRAPLGLDRARALQVHNRYLITESAEGVVVIDQHALHERIIYEQLREKVGQGQLESQRLLVPEPVPLSAPEFALVHESQDALNRLGIVVEPFGGTTMLVTAYPAMLANHNPAEMLRSVVELLAARNSPLERRDVLDELMHMISCKAAVKAGDRLTAAEIESLLEYRALCQDAHHCPHGRPTALIFSRDELDRRFLRT